MPLPTLAGSVSLSCDHGRNTGVQWLNPRCVGCGRGQTCERVPLQAVHNVAVAGQRPLTLVLHSVGRFTALRDLSVALFRSYGADNFFASLPPSLTRLRASGMAGFKVILLQQGAAMAIEL